MTSRKVVLIGLDGLRPDMIRVETTPHLATWRSRGVTFANHRACFPSDTFVNMASLVTGAPPQGHGLIANDFPAAASGVRAAFHGASIASVDRFIAAAGGALYGATSLGEHLAAHCMSLSVICSCSPGGARLLHHTAADHRHLVIAMRENQRHDDREPRNVRDENGADSDSDGDGDGDGDGEAVGDILSRQVDLFFGLIADDALPEMTVLWFGEPDDAWHAHGFTAPRGLRALHRLDGQIGRIIDWWEHVGGSNGVQLMVMSDHGHVTQGKKASVRTILEDAGFSVAGAGEEGDADVTIVPGAAAGLWLAGNNDALARDLSSALQASPACGLLFSKGKNNVDGWLPGTFARSLVMLEHERAPDLVMTLAECENQDGTGRAVYYDGGGEPGASTHGGLTRDEMACCFMAAGDLFKEGVTINGFSGVRDIAPTLLRVLGVGRPRSMTGRVLSEAFAGGRSDGAENRREVETVGAAGYAQRLSRVRAGGAIYLDEGTRVE